MRHPEGGEFGHVAVMEAVLVACVILGSVFFVATQVMPSPTPAHTPATLAAASQDALAVLSDLPASRAAHESLLEELVTQGLRGDCANASTKLGVHFPTGAAFALTLENGYGGQRAVCGSGTALGEQVGASTLIQPRWTHVFVRANVSQVTGKVSQDLTGNETQAFKYPLSFQAVYVRNSFLDSSTPLTLGFPNNHSVTLPPSDSVRHSGQLPPERVTETGHKEGYAVPYVVDSGLEAYTLSSSDATQPERQFTPRTPIANPEGHYGEYVVHPRYELASSLSASIVSMVPQDRFGASTRIATLGEDVNLSWNYGWIARNMPSAELSDANLRIYDPVGVVERELVVTNTTQSETYHVQRDSLWGTYVAHLQFRMEELNDVGEATGTMYFVNQLTEFQVRPPAWVHAESAEAVPPPVYRVSLAVGPQT